MSPLDMAEVQVGRAEGSLSAWFAVKKVSGTFEKKHLGDQVSAYSICSVVINWIEVNWMESNLRFPQKAIQRQKKKN